ncbi:hypothetical protein J6590_028039 [Homalodisca vitripennis]|nr:hypothetical protein J6590_028039 [Homalodisca vitripennis]
MNYCAAASIGSIRAIRQLTRAELKESKRAMPAKVMRRLSTRCKKQREQLNPEVTLQDIKILGVSQTNCSPEMTYAADLVTFQGLVCLVCAEVLVIEGVYEHRVVKREQAIERRENRFLGPSQVARPSSSTAKVKASGPRQPTTDTGPLNYGSEFKVEGRGSSRSRECCNGLVNPRQRTAPRERLTETNKLDGQKDRLKSNWFSTTINRFSYRSANYKPNHFMHERKHQKELRTKRYSRTLSFRRLTVWLSTALYDWHVLENWIKVTPQCYEDLSVTSLSVWLYVRLDNWTGTAGKHGKRPSRFVVF